ncbi:MAG: hypothetical protein ABR587_00115 [Candidatus Binatia bacterium]
MNVPKASRTPSRLARAAVVIVLLGLVLAAAGGDVLRLLTHGLTWDEHPQLQSLRANMELATSGRSEPQGLFVSDFRGQQEYYGIVNKLPGLLLWRTAQLLRGEDTTLWQYDHSALAAFHSTALAFGVVAVWGCRRMAMQWPGGPIASLAAPVLLLLYPRFMGHAFFNLKDIPFAAIYTLLTWQIAHALTASKLAASRRATLNVVLLGGLLAAIKAPGVAAMWPMFLAGVVSLWVHREDSVSDRKLRFAWIVAPLLALAIAVALTPAAWGNPSSWIQGALGLFGQYPWERCTVSWGECVPAIHTPADYLPKWFAVTTPAVVLFLFAWAIVELFRAPWFSAPLHDEPAAASTRTYVIRFGVVASQLLTFPIIAIGTGAALYDAERHFLFIVPSACVIAAFGLARFLQRSLVWPRVLRASALLALSLSAVAVVVDAWRLHPYQYSYYNELGRHLDPSRNFETDFWGFSLGELARRQVVIQPAPAAWAVRPFVAMPNTVYPFTPSLPRNYRNTVQVTGGDAAPYARVRTTTRVFGINRFEWRDPPRECRQIDVEERRLLFATTTLVMGRTLLCEPRFEPQP